MSPTKGTHYSHTAGHTRAAHRKTAALVRGRCQCNDTQCLIHKPSDICANTATTIMYRVDMTDETGTAVCDGCAEDMANSGLFADEDHLED